MGWLAKGVSRMFDWSGQRHIFLEHPLDGYPS